MTQCYSVQEFARLVGKSDLTIRRWITSGILNATKPAGTRAWIIPASELPRLTTPAPKTTATNN